MLNSCRQLFPSQLNPGYAFPLLHLLLENSSSSYGYFPLVPIQFVSPADSSAFGVDPSEVHIHVRHIPVKEIPTSEDENTSWLIDAFKLKEQLLSDFKLQGPYRTEGELSALKCFLNFTMVIFLAAIFSYLTYSFNLFRTYVVLACLCLAYVTYYNIPPVSLQGIDEALSHHKEKKRK